MAGGDYQLEVQPRLPKKLERLTELAGNLIYSWDRGVRGIFYRIDPELWGQCGHNPMVFLRRVSQSRLDELSRSPDFLLQFRQVMDAFDAYLSVSSVEVPDKGQEMGLVAYFCMEYGLHESLQLYSGGLGILAGDHCKAASDLDLPFVAVGLMYRQGYFTQTLDRDGFQEMHYRPLVLADLPVARVTDGEDRPVEVRLELPDREVVIAVWVVRVGRICLYLLDTDLPENSEDDRFITYQLYGGDRVMRITQELVLGVGGVRALRAMGLAPDAWHVNEGHPAFLILERCREQVEAGLGFDAALEAVAAATVFTTHTAVAAGHDLFTHDIASRFLAPLADAMDVPMSRLLALAASPQREGAFNMTALALRGSRRHNGVSAVHRDVAAGMESHIWPEIPPEDNPLITISNGVHVPTFLAREWVGLFDGRYPEWRQHAGDRAFWERTICSIPDHRFWSLTQSLKSEMLDALRDRLLDQYHRNNYARARIDGMEAVFSPENTRPLIIGFARRFATYKRALLVFEDLDRLARLLNDEDRPVIMLFAGKAHPQDVPGQALIRRIHEFACMPAFLNRIFLLEGYDIALARKLVTGVDVWLNTPEYPLEASGTSGQKAAMNGVINLSVLDGWWAEGHDGENGWGIAPHNEDLPPDERDAVEAEDLLDLLEHEVIPAYFRIGPGGYSPDWVRRSKRSMFTVLPRFNAERMVREYRERLYAPAAAQAGRLLADGAAQGRELAQWKARIREAWPGVSMDWRQPPPTGISTGQVLSLVVAVNANGLTSDDLRLECVLYPARERTSEVHAFRADESGDGVEEFRLRVTMTENGLYRMEIRLYPWHPLLAHPFEMGCLRSL